MLVKTWGQVPGQANSNDPLFTEKATALVDTIGAAGQGNENPPPYFWDHAIVKAGKMLSAALYDPSYATGPFPTEAELNEIEAMTRAQPNQATVLTQYQKASMTGFCKPDAPQPRVPGKPPVVCLKSEGSTTLGLGVVEGAMLNPNTTTWWPNG
jgi:hypothetical protein